VPINGMVSSNEEIWKLLSSDSSKAISAEGFVSGGFVKADPIGKFKEIS